MKVVQPAVLKTKFGCRSTFRELRPPDIAPHGGDIFVTGVIHDLLVSGSGEVGLGHEAGAETMAG